MSEKNTVKLVQALIDRGRDVIGVVVPEHEVLVLRAVHGRAEVTVTDPHVDDAELDRSADVEIGRLQRRYRRINSPDPVLAAFPTGAADLERFGFAQIAGALPTEVNTGIRRHAPKKAALKAPAKA